MQSFAEHIIVLDLFSVCKRVEGIQQEHEFKILFIICH